jgi:hypothetical protein
MIETTTSVCILVSQNGGGPRYHGTYQEGWETSEYSRLGDITELLSQLPGTF